MHFLPPDILENVFDVYNFFIISSLFDTNKPDNVSTHNRKNCEQNVSYLVKHSE